MKTVEWHLHLNSGPDLVYEFLATAEGRKKFWAEEAPEKEGVIHFKFPNGEACSGKIIHTRPNKEFHLEYFNSMVRFELVPDGDQGTDLTLTNEGVTEDEYLDVYAGWVSVLLNLKAAVDFGFDLRNHDQSRTWSQKYVDN